MSKGQETMNALLTALSGVVGEKLVLEDDGVCQLGTDDGGVINIGYNDKNENVVLFAPIGSLRDENRENAMEVMLQANHFWSETGGATLSLSEDGYAAIIAYQVPVAEIHHDEFISLVEWFFNTSSEWRQRLENQMKYSSPPKEDAAKQVTHSWIKI